MALEKYTKYIDRNGKCVLPEGIKVIEEAAFENCEELKEVSIPNSVTKIGEDAFWRCTSLKKIVCPKRLIGKRYGDGKTMVEIGDASVPADIVVELEKVEAEARAKAEMEARLKAEAKEEERKRFIASYNATNRTNTFDSSVLKYLHSYDESSMLCEVPE